VHHVALVHFADGGLIERMAGPADEHQHDAHMHQISAVAARVAVRQLDHRRDQADVRLFVDGARAADEFHHDSRGDKEAETETNDRVGLAHAADEERGDDNQHADPRPLEILAQAFHRRAAPREQRAHAGEE